MPRGSVRRGRPPGAWDWDQEQPPLAWLLEDSAPAVRHRALFDLAGNAPDHESVREALRQAMASPPIATILDNQDAEGFWAKPGAGYSPKYRGTSWQVIFLAQLGADPEDPRVQRGCEYVLTHARVQSGAFAASGQVGNRLPPSAAALHCLNGNLLHALIGFGRLSDPRVEQAIDWLARSVTGEQPMRYFRSGVSGPGFACAVNEDLPCAWGAIPAVLALTAIPAAQRTPLVDRAIEQGATFLLSRDPAAADYPMGWGNTRPNASWFKPGFPPTYVADVLRNLEALCAAGFASHPRLLHAFEWLLEQRDADGRWRNRYASNGKTWCDFEKQGEPSKWVTLRACRVLKARNDG